MRDDEQKPHRRLSTRASWHNTTKPAGSGGRVNAAFVHGRFTLLSGEVCASCDGKAMRGIRTRSNRLNNDPAYLSAVDGYESPGGDTKQAELMTDPVVLRMATYGVSVQKSAEGIVLPALRKEGPNAEMEDDTCMSSHAAMNPTGGAEE